VEYQREQLKFTCRGIDLAHPVDLTSSGKFPFLKNVRSRQDGRLEARPGAAKSNTTQLSGGGIHSISRVNDYILSTFARFIGVGTKLYRGTTSYVDTGLVFSGNPLSIVPYRPENSPRTYAYIADSIILKKLATTGASEDIGVDPPIDLPSVELDAGSGGFLYTGSDNPINWIAGGTAGVPTNQDRVDNTILTVNYHYGGSGFCSVTVNDAVAQSINEGMFVSIAGQLVMVEETYKVATTPTTIAAITYKSGTNGFCSILPARNISGLRRNCVVNLGGENVRVLSVSNGPNNVSSFTCVTSATFSPGAIITPRFTFVAHTGSVISAGNTIYAPSIKSTIAEGEGHLTFFSTSPSLLTSNQWGLGPDDFMHFSIWIDKPERLVEGKVVIECSSATTGPADPNFGKVAGFFRTFRPNDFAAVVTNEETLDATKTAGIQKSVQDATDLPQTFTNTLYPPEMGMGATPSQDIEKPVFVPPPAGGSSQISLGNNQWTEMKFRLSDLIQVGSSVGVSLDKIFGFRFEFVTDGDIQVRFRGLLNTFGGGGPDSSEGRVPFVYRARYRNSITGARSFPGPANFSGIVSNRRKIRLDFVPSSQAGVDKIDIERFGGNNLEWHYVGTCNNSTPAFFDTQASAAIVTNPPLELDVMKPFVLIDTPKAVNVAVTGNIARYVSGDNWSTSWARGTQVRLNGIYTTLWASPSGAGAGSHVLLADNVGAGNVVMEVQEPILQGQPLAAMWGPYKETLFGCGNPKAPGFVYFTRFGDPDGSSDSMYVEVTSPSETMMNGLLYNNRAFAFSDQRLFGILPSGSAGKFEFVEVPNGKGLANKWSFCVGPKIWFVSNDGIYETDGGEPLRISDDIQPLFPTGDLPGVAVNGMNPVKMNGPLRLAYHGNYLFFDYQDTDNIYQTAVYDISTKAWFPDNYFSSPSRGFLTHYAETDIESGGNKRVTLLAGGNDGFFYTFGGFSDDGDPISCSIRVPVFNGGDTRAKKIFGELVFDMDPQGASILCTPYLDNYSTQISGTTFSNPSRLITNPIDLQSGLGQFARNLGVDISWSSSIASPKMYFWEPSFLSRPEDTFLRADDWTDGGYAGSKLVWGFLLESDTDGATKGFKLDGDQTELESYSDSLSGQLVKAYSVVPPKIASLLRLRPSQSVSWRKFRVSYLYEKYPENARIFTPYSNEGTPDAKFIQGALITALGVDPACVIEYDGAQSHTETMNLVHLGTALGTRPYSFANPFIAHELRLAPSTAIRIGNIKWIWEPAPELAMFWETQETTHDIPGWQFLKYGFIAHQSFTDITLNITVDGTVFGFIIPSSNGLYKKDYILFAVKPNGRTIKGKYFKYRLYSSNPFRLFVKDCEISVHSWNGGSYQVVKPFGGLSREAGARI